MPESIQVDKEEYEELKETVETLSSRDDVKKINNALNRIEKGEFLREDEV